jgi:hypothetical protein
MIGAEYGIRVGNVAWVDPAQRISFDISDDNQVLLKLIILDLLVGIRVLY